MDGSIPSDLEGRCLGGVVVVPRLERVESCHSPLTRAPTATITMSNRFPLCCQPSLFHLSCRPCPGAPRKAGGCVVQTSRPLRGESRQVRAADFGELH